MKNLPIILSSLALLGVIILFGMKMGSKNPAAATDTNIHNTPHTKIAYVDIDSFESNYDYLISQRAVFQKKQENMEAELKRSERQFNNSAQDFQKKVQSGNITEAEAIATEKKLMQMRESLMLREQSMTSELLKEKEAFNTKLHNDLDAFLKEYNEEKKFDYILSYSSIGSQILLSNPSFNITKDVIKGMNALSKKQATDSLKNK